MKFCTNQYSEMFHTTEPGSELWWYRWKSDASPPSIVCYSVISASRLNGIYKKERQRRWPKSIRRRQRRIWLPCEWQRHALTHSERLKQKLMQPNRGNQTKHWNQIKENRIRQSRIDLIRWVGTDNTGVEYNRAKQKIIEQQSLLSNDKTKQKLFY